MARPREIRLEHGLISLRNFPKNVLNQMEAHIAKFKLDETISIPVEEIEVVKEFKDKALGLSNVGPKKFELVVIAYNLDSKEAFIEETKNAGEYLDEAQSMYRQELFKRGLS